MALEVTLFDTTLANALKPNVDGSINVISTSTATTASPTPTQPVAVSTGGFPLNFKLPSSANSTNGTLISGQQRQVFFIAARNTSTVGDVFLKLYNKATAPTVGTDVPVMTVCIPFSGGLAIPITMGANLFTLGLGFALTGGAADADTTVISLGQITGLNIGYA